MHFGVFFYGTVDMPDAGIDGPPAHQRQYSPTATLVEHALLSQRFTGA